MNSQIANYSDRSGNVPLRSCYIVSESKDLVLQKENPIKCKKLKSYVLISQSEPTETLVEKMNCNIVFQNYLSLLAHNHAKMGLQMTNFVSVVP